VTISCQFCIPAKASCLPLQWQVTFKTAVHVWNTLHSIISAYLQQPCIPAMVYIEWMHPATTGADINRTVKVCFLCACRVEQSATSPA